MMLSTETKMVGGEQELENEGLFYGVTNSGTFITKVGNSLYVSSTKEGSCSGLRVSDSC